MKIKSFILTFFFAFMAVGMAAQTDNAQKKKRRAERYDTGSFVSFSVGAGMSGLSYRPDGGTMGFMPSGSLNVDYIYYFTKKIGIGTGLGVSYYGGTAHLVDPLIFSGLTDYEGQAYTHRIEFDRWSERQNMTMLEVPIAFHYKDKAFQTGWFFSAGLRLGIPVSASYTHYRGGLSNTAYYPLWNLTVHDLPNRFESVPYHREHDRIVGIHYFNVLGSAEVGGIWQLSKRVDLRVAGYVEYCFNDMLRQRQAAKPALGFAGHGNSSYDYMAVYDGLVGTSVVHQLHPFAFGVKAGVTLYTGLTEQQKKKKVREFLQQYEQYIQLDTVLVHDTVVLERLDTVYLRDTISKTDVLTLSDTLMLLDSLFFVDTLTITDTVYIREVKEAIMDLDSLLSEAVIWFRFDEYVPILEPADVLDKVAEQLRRHPRLSVHVNGHACDIGTDEYNLQLAMRRAQAVARLLREKGVKNEQLDIRSFGSHVPFRYNSDHQKSKDRRVEVIPFYR